MRHPPRTCLRMVSASGDRSLIEPFERGRCVPSALAYLAFYRSRSSSIREFFRIHAKRNRVSFCVSLRRAANNRALFTWTRARIMNRPSRLLPLKSRQGHEKNSFFVSLFFSAILAKPLQFSAPFLRTKRKTKITEVENKRCEAIASVCFNCDCMNTATGIKLRISMVSCTLKREGYFLAFRTSQVNAPFLLEKEPQR